VADNFDWRTDDNGEWEGSRPHRVRPARRRRWILPLAIILTIIVAGGAIYWQVQKRVAAAEAVLGDEVRSSFQLISQANDEGDIELFRNLLSGSDLEWASDLQELFSQGWLFDLRPYGLSSAPLAVGDVEVTLSPELNSAEVSALATYRASSGAAPGTVRLRQTKVFRKGERWVWAPPREAFWSGDATVQERYLSVSYPVRDEDLVLRLARDLDLLAAGLCNEVAGLTCPDNLMLELLFSREPGAMLAISEQFAGQGLFGSRLIRSRQQVEAGRRHAADDLANANAVGCARG